jgi:nucleotide-binding universal stress UspA family protein
MKHIVVPFDFSHPATEALKFAAQLATKEDADILMIHAIEFPVMVNTSVALELEKKYIEVHRAEAIRRMRKIAARVAKNARVDFRVDFGGTIAAILRAVKTFDADAIVMGTNGASGLEELTVGSNTQRVVRKSRVPVIVIRKAVKSISNIVLPILPEAEDLDETIKSIKDLQQTFNAKLHILYINTPTWFKREIESKAGLENFVRRYNLKDATVNVINDHDEESGIINFAKEMDEPMVVMATHGHQGIRHFMMGSLAEDVVNHIDCPITTFRMHE